MRSIWWIFDATRRRRWGAWLALALLIALVGGAVLAGAGAARATQRAFPDFERHYGANVGVYEAGEPWTKYVRLPMVSSYVVSVALANGNAESGSTIVPGQDLSVLSLPIAGSESRSRLIAGRLPRARNEVMVGFSLQQDANLHLGSTIKVPFLAASQYQQLGSNSSFNVGKGYPSFTFRVVGVYVSMLDFPSASPSYSMIVSPAFMREDDPHLANNYLILLRLHGGVNAIPQYSAEVKRLNMSGFAYPFAVSLVSNVVNGSLHPLVIGWWLFALVTGLVGLALMAQALSRQSIIERLAYPTLSALGVAPSQLFWLGMLRSTVIGIAGAGGAVALAVLASPFTLVGEARAAEPSRGVNLDPLVLGLGAAAIIAGVLALAVLPSWRASRARSLFGTQEAPLRRANPVASLAARAGAPPAMLIGVRHALERGRGRSSVPVATALLGTVAAVVALVGSLVFGASLNNLLATPRLWGQAWQLDVGGFSGGADASTITGLAKSPQVRAADYGVSQQEIDVNGVPVNMVAYVIAKGAPVFADIAGRDPTAPGEIALGSTTAADAHATVGSRVKVAIFTPDGKAHTADMRVVGLLAVPPTLSGGAVGDGSIMLLSSMFDTLCGSGGTSSACRAGLHRALYSPQVPFWGAAVAFRDTKAAHALLLATERRLSGYLTVITRPSALVNFGGGINFPVLLGLVMALFGAATLMHLMVVSVSRRRREHAVLRVIGFVRAQVRGVVCWQAATIAAIGILVGVPLGIAAGRLAWRAFAGAQGVIDQPIVPGARLALVGGVVVAVSVLFSMAPAAWATRLRPSGALRNE